MKTKLLALSAVFASLCVSVQGQLIDKTPVLHLSFDNVSGSTVINDGTGGSGMNGTLNGTAVVTNLGKFGANCLSISGANANSASCRIANAVVPLTVASNWTVAMWVQTTTVGGCYAYQGDGGWGPDNSDFYLNNGSAGGTGQGGVRYGTGWETGTAAVNDGTWHHLTMTCSNGVKTLYLDGNVDAFIAAGYNGNGWTTAGAGAQFWIGGNGYNGDGSANLNGLIDEVYVFNRTLSQTDVQMLVASNYFSHVPVTLAVNPTSGYRGQSITLTATATPAVGTVTNATVDLSAIGLSAATNLVLSSANVFTNSFTVPNTTNAVIGARNLKVTVTSDEPLIGGAGATFTVLARPPTNATVVTQITNVSVYQYAEASFRFNATNDANNDASWPMTYSWYTNNVLVSTNPMGPYLTFLTVPSDTGMQVYAIGRVADTNYSSIAVTSAVATLTLKTGSATYTNGLKREFIAGGTRQGAEIGNTGPGVVSVQSQAQLSGGFGDNYAQRFSGYFIPPTTDGYVFFVASDDDCDVFISTDSNPANKRLVAQEVGWSGSLDWLGSTSGGGSTAAQKRSDQWTNGVGATPYSTGIQLNAGQPYYFEAVMHQGGGGDNWAVTYQTTNQMADPNWAINFTNGVPSIMTAASNNIALITWAGTNIQWTLQPANITMYEGTSTNAKAIAVSDSEMALNYQWYIVTNGGSFPGFAFTGSVINGTNGPLALVPASYNNAQIYCIASTQEGGLSSTSSVATLTVIQSVFESGWVSEKKWMDTFNIAGAENGTITAATNFSYVRAGFLAGLDNPSATVNGTRHDSTAQQIGYFVAPSNGNYAFFITSHDGGDLFLSTDNTASHKRLIAQEAGWTDGYNWNNAGGGGSVVAQKRSDSFVPAGSNTPPYAAGIPLVAGQRYYMEVDHTTSQWGNEQWGVYYNVMQGGFATAPANGTLPNVTGNVVGLNAIRCSYVNFTQQPTNVTTTPMGYATFAVAGTTDSQYPVCSSYGYTISAPTNVLFYQWYKNGTPIPGANGKSLTLGPLLAADSGATVYCAMRALGYADNSLNPIWTNSQTATVTVSGDAIFEPGYVWVDWWTNSGNNLAAVEGGAAGKPSYSFVTPKFASPTGGAGGFYVNRASTMFIAPSNSNYSFFVNGDDGSDLFVNTNGSTPSGKILVAQEAGWSNPLQWLTAGGGGSVLSQKRSDQFIPAGAPYAPYSSGFAMTAGQKYWMEGVHINTGNGNNNFAATYKDAFYGSDPVNGADTKLTGSLVGIYVPRMPYVTILQQPTNQTAMSGGNPVTFSIQGTNPATVWVDTTGNPANWITNPPTASLQYQWYKNGTPIPGATSSSYTQPYVLPSDQGAQFVCGLRALGLADSFGNRIYSNSQPAVLTVVTDTAPPTISYAATFQNTNTIPPQLIVNVTFSEWMSEAALTNIGTYSIAGVNITNVTIASNHRTVQLLVDALPTLPVNVTVTGATDLSGNALVANSAAINAEKLTFTDIGTPPYYDYYYGQAGYDPAYPSVIRVIGNGGYLVSAEGSDIWNAQDGFNFGWEMKTNDFDVVVRNLSVTPSSAYAKAGLMVRESLDKGSREWSIQNEPLAAVGGANRIDTAMRTTNNIASANWQVGTLPPPSYPNAWLRLKRTGNVMAGYYSTNGVDWVQTGSYDTSTNANGALSNAVYVGICTTGHNNDVVTTYPPPAPTYYNTAEYADYNSSYVPSVPATLVVNKSGGNVIVSWTPTGGHLESSPVLAGPGVNWQPVLPNNNPSTNSIGSGTLFFRVVNP